MKKRNPLAVFVLGLVTLSIYSIYWYVVTKEEMKARGADIPTALLLIVPFANIWWLWKYSQGVEQVTNTKLQAVLAFLLLWLLGQIGQAIVQNYFNEIEAGGSPAEPTAPAPPVAPSPVA